MAKSFHCLDLSLGSFGAGKRRELPAPSQSHPAMHSSITAVSRRKRAAMWTFVRSPLPCRGLNLLAAGDPFASMAASRRGHDWYTRYKASGWSTAYTPAVQIV
jgi:hypothetical protein